MSDFTVSGVVSRWAGSLFGNSASGQRVTGNMVGALQFAGDRRGQLWLNDFEILFRQRGGKFVVREQLHAAFKLIRQNLQREIRARRFIRADVVQRLLKGQPVQ